ncbi:MAG: bifunctional pyr operon transcriptional regulator/uracil phosphoribosyltransferase PyrR [Chitinivibrionales bacterium]|nr:bifunctional pyr operon transcriptional regulator/uracil phosphoribosyltransferase PyrR [Chitinivibrionales bacterium]
MKPVELLMDAAALDRALTRMTHQILEKNSPQDLGIVGMQTRGVFLARRLVEKINAVENHGLVAGILDPTLYRDDYRIALRQPKVKITDIPFNINGINLVLVDDVLYTGRTVRAALDAITDFGRPKSIQLAVLIDRGHRQMPIAAEYIGREITTAENQEVALRVRELDNEDSVWLMELEAGDKK